MSQSNVAAILTGLVEAADIDGVLSLALSKIKLPDELCDGKSIPVGKHNFKGRFLIDIEGTVTKGEGYTQEVPGKINWTLAFALALSQVNENHRMALYAAIDAASRNPAAHEEAVSKVKEEAEERIAFLKEMTKTKCEGKTTFAKNGKCEVRLIP